MPDIFQTKKSVCEFLQMAGWQTSQSQFYQHCKAGFLRPGKDGKYQLKAVEKYAKQYLRLKETGERVNDKFDKMQEDKLQVELSTARVKLEREQHDLGVKKGRFVPREEFELSIVARAVAFMAHLNHTVQSLVPDWIDLVEGNQGRAAELVAAISEAIEQRMGDFAADVETEVYLEANE